MGNVVYVFISCLISFYSHRGSPTAALISVALVTVKSPSAGLLNACTSVAEIIVVSLSSLYAGASSVPVLANV